MPTVKGFNVNIEGTAQDIKYDYKYLDNNTDIASEYSDSSLYSVGDYCHKDGQLYICKVSIESPGESWTALHWTSVNAIDELDKVKNQLNNEFSFDSSTWQIGTLNPGVGSEDNTSTTRVRSPFIKVNGGEIITVSGNSDCLIVYCYATTDWNSYISDSSWTDGNYFVVPEGVGYIRILIRKSSSNEPINAGAAEDEDEAISTQVDRCTIRKSLSPGVYDFNYDIEDVVHSNYSLITEGKSWDKEGTVETAYSYFYMYFNPPIPKGTLMYCKKADDNEISWMSLNITNDPTVSSSSTYTKLSPNNGPWLFTAPFDIYGARSYCDSSGKAHLLFNTQVDLNSLSSVNSSLSSINSDLVLNKFIVSATEGNVYGIQYSKVDNNSINFNGIASTEQSTNNIGISVRNIDVSKFKRFKFYVMSEVPHSIEDEYWLNVGYYEGPSDQNGHNIINIPFNEWCNIEFPQAATQSKFYLHTKPGYGYTNEIIKFYMYILDDDQYDIITNNLTGNSFNSTYHTGLTNYADPCTRFSSLMSGDTINDVYAVEECESFLFFTDPHTQHSTHISHFAEYMGQIQKVYHSTPTYFVLSGGDWLGAYDTPDVASYKMGLIGATCRTMLDPCYMLVGNHDTNYQGKKDSSSAAYTTRLPNASISNLWYEGKTAYYTFNGMHTKFYCFDTGTEDGTGAEDQSLTAFNNYGYRQCQWFANSLLTDNSEHIALAMHIYYRNGTTFNSISSLIMQIADAYNKRTSILVNGTSYDYSSSTGFIEFVIAGHKHADETTTYNGIPVIMTIDVGNGQTYPTDASFDLMFVDYDNRVIKCVRVGSGSDRTVSLASLS